MPPGMDGILAKVAIVATPGSGGRSNQSRKLAGAVAGNNDKVLVRGHSIQGRKYLPGFRKGLVVQIFPDLQEHIVDAQRVVMHGAVEIGKIGLLARESLEYAEEICGNSVECVVEGDVVRLGAAVVDKGFFTEIRDPAVHFQLQAIEVMELRREIKYRCHQGRVNVHRPGV